MDRLQVIMDDTVDADEFPKEGSGATGGSPTHALQQFGHWVRERLSSEPKSESNSESGSDSQ